MILNHAQQGVGSAVVTDNWTEAVKLAAQQAGANFPPGAVPGLIEVRIIAKEQDKQ